MTSTSAAGLVVRDLTDAGEQAAVLELADRLFADSHHRREARAGINAIAVEAAACAASAAAIRAIVKPVHLTVVWAMYKESKRILRRSQHPHGEDFLFEKIRQIEWLADHNSLLTWDLIAVDDGCPDEPSSGDVAAKLVNGAGIGERVTVLRLADAIEQRFPVSASFHTLDSPDDSRKGGAIAFGMWAAVTNRAGVIPAGADHVVLYTDADLSTNLAQAGSLVIPVLDGAAAAAGQRYGVPRSALVGAHGVMREPQSTGTKPDRMIVLLRHAIRSTLIPQLAPVLDTQAGFKAFRADVVRSALPWLDGFRETFDVELLLHAASTAKARIAAPPIVFVEDFAATNFPSVDPGQSHLDMIHQIADIHDRQVVGRDAVGHVAGAMREFVRELDLARYVAIVDALTELDEPPANHTNMFDVRWSTAALTELGGAA